MTTVSVSFPIRLRQCSQCLLPGQVCTDPERSAFHLRSVRPLRWRRDCKHCVRERVRRYPARPRARRADPNNAQHQRDWRRRNREDPVRAARQREKRRAHDELRRLDSERQRAHLETRRIAYRLRRERAGVMLVLSEDPSASQGARLDPAPLRAWIAERKLAYGSWEALAHACVSGEESVEDRERTLHRISDVDHPQGWVSEAQVDQILSREGSTMLSQLYPELGVAA